MLPCCLCRAIFGTVIWPKKLFQLVFTCCQAFAGLLELVDFGENIFPGKCQDLTWKILMKMAARMECVFIIDRTLCELGLAGC